MPGFILNDGAVVPPSVYSAMNTVLNKKLGTSQVYPPRDWAAIVKDLVPLPLKSASGSIAHFEDGADTVPLKSLTYRFTPTQSGTGDPSPSNPRPITGVSSVNVVHTGANLWDEEHLSGYYSSSGSYTYNAGQLCTKNKIEVKPNTTYRLVLGNLTGNQGQSVCFYEKGGTFISRTLNVYEFTTPNNCSQINVNFGSNYGGTYNNDISINYPSTDTQYHSYQATLTPVSLGQTVYGGEGNEAGEFISTYKLANLSTMDWDSGAPNQDGYIRFVNHSAWGDKANGYKLFCDKFPVKTSLIPSSPTTIGISGYTSNANIYIAVESSMLTGDLSTNAGRNTAFRNWISDNGLQIIYELATPATLSVDPVAISSRLGVNNIFSDLAASEIECEYYADPTLSTQ